MRNPAAQKSYPARIPVHPWNVPKKEISVQDAFRIIAIPSDSIAMYCIFSNSTLASFLSRLDLHNHFDIFRT